MDAFDTKHSFVSMYLRNFTASNHSFIEKQKHIQNPVEDLGWSFFTRIVNDFIVDVQLDSKCASECCQLLSNCPRKMKFSLLKLQKVKVQEQVYYVQKQQWRHKKVDRQ